ncbi:MAG: YbhN family protein [Hyphomicrobiaceae bacterium]
MVSAFLALTVVYVGALFLLDDKLSLARLADAARVLPWVVGFGAIGMGLRFIRWRWLLARCGSRVPWRQALSAYLTGFAFTATPGKVGELVRARYFGRLGVPHATVVAGFVFERGLDLLVVFAFASVIAARVPGFAIAAAFVVLVVAGLLIVARMSRVRRWLQYHLRKMGWRLPARLVRTVLGGIEQAQRLLTWRDALVAGGLGVLAWSCHLAGFACAMAMLGVRLEPLLLMAIPAAAMLVGAASMLPGGLGATETAIVVLLVSFGERLELAALAAVTIRLGSIWFSILVGLAAVAWLERRAN